MARRGLRVLWLGLEEPVARVQYAMCCQMTGVTAGTKQPADQERLRAALDALTLLPLHIPDNPSRSVATLRMLCESQYAEALGGPPEVVIVDTADALAKQGESLYEIGTRHADALEAWAHQSGALLLAAKQLNRRSAGVAPALSDLRDSGAWEEKADAVLGLHRPGAAMTPTERAQAGEAVNHASLLPLKNRWGGQEPVSLYWAVEQGPAYMPMATKPLPANADEYVPVYGRDH
jgi:replicative DNA helicase